jgi:hypothetical protein
MSKLIVLRIEPGDFDHGFPVVLQIGEEGQPPLTRWQGMIPPAPELPTLYQAWQSMYYHLGKARWGLRISVPTQQITNISNTQSCEQLADRFSSQLQQWLSQPAFQSLNLEILDQVSVQESARVILQTDDYLLRRFPWHLWSLFDRRPQAELALYTPASQESIAFPLEAPVKVLAILGHDEGLDLQSDWQSISQLPHTQITLLDQPSLQEINEQLWKKPWDILFFAGHSMAVTGLDDTEASLGLQHRGAGSRALRGQLRLNPQGSTPLHQLQYALTHAVQQGLKLAMFNSCDGLSLTDVLEEARVPQVIVMREPVPDRVAQTFLRYLLEDFAAGNPWHLAMRQAREKLQWMESEFPCATWLPVMCQSPAIAPQLWPRTGVYPEPNPDRPQVLLTPRSHIVPSRPSSKHPAQFTAQASRTSHCINPACHAPGPHAWTAEKCPTCGTKLRLNDRFIPVKLEKNERHCDYYQAYDRQTKSFVDLQVYYDLDDVTINRLKQETETLRSIYHVSLPKVIGEVFTIKSSASLLLCRALSPMSGTPLQTSLDRADPQAVLQWFQQAIQTLAILHEHHLVHGNLTSHSWIDRRNPATGAVSWGLTGLGSLRSSRGGASGKAMPPELDCYAVGMMTIQWLTGHHPYDFLDRSTGQIKWSQVDRSLPKPWIKIINQMVHPDPKQRPRSAQSLVPQVASLQLPSTLFKQPLKSMMKLYSQSYSQPRSQQVRSQQSKAMDRSTFLDLGDAAIALLRQSGLTMLGGAVTSAVSGGILMWTFFDSPIAVILTQSLQGFRISPALAVFALTSAITAWMIGMIQDDQTEPRFWLTGLLMAIGYGVLWKALPHYTSLQALLSLGLLLALFTVLGTGNYRHLWLKMLITVGGTLPTLFIWRQSKLWQTGDLLLTLQGQWKTALNPYFWSENLLIFAGLGGFVALWFSLSLAITHRLTKRS